MVKKLAGPTFEEFYIVNEQVANTSPMHTHYHSKNPLESWLWQQKKQVICNILNNLNIENIIDLGCGDGGLIDVIDENIKYTGIDISPTQIKYVKNQIKHLGRKNARVYNGDILNLNFKSNTFDAALVCDVVEHVLSPKKLFDETKRVVKKDGYIIFSIPNEPLLQLSRALLLRFPLRSPDHINAVFPNDIKKEFSNILNETYIPIKFSFALSLIGIILVKNEKKL